MSVKSGPRPGRDGSPRLLREINDRAAIGALLHHGPLTRGELEGIIGLSKPATAALLARLEKADMVCRVGLRGGHRGPRAQTWRVNGELARVAAVDLTPEAVDIAIADLSGTVLAERRADMLAPDCQTMPVRFAGELSKAAAQAGLRTSELRHVVVGSPGAVDPATGHLGFAPQLPGWEGFDVPGSLRGLLGTEVTVENDVNLVALEELHSGRGRDVRNFVLLWLSRGVGSGIVIDRTLLRGATGGAGEIDAMWVPDRAARDTGVGRAGTRYGALISPGAIAQLARAHGLTSEDSESAIREALSAGATGADFLIDLSRRVATGLAAAVSILDPDLVLLSAEIAQAGGERLAELVGAELRRLVATRTRVELAAATGDPVRAGALHVALDMARSEVFGLSRGDG